VLHPAGGRSSAGRPQALAEVREEIGRILQWEARRVATRDWLNALRGKTFLRYYGVVSGDPVWTRNRVVKIEIKHVGASTVSDALIRSHLHVKEGELVTQASVDHDVRSLYGTGDFSDIRVSEAVVDGGSKLIYVVQERPVLSGIEFAGNKNLSSRELLQKLTSKPGERLDERKLFNDSLAIQSIYERAGYPRATVKCVQASTSRAVAAASRLKSPKARNSVAPMNQRLNRAALARNSIAPYDGCRS